MCDWRCDVRLRPVIFSLPLMLLACGKGDDSFRPPSSPQPARSVAITGPTEAIAGQVIQLRARLSTDGVLTDVSRSAQWTSNNLTVLSVDAGLATAHAVGFANVTARYEGMQGSRVVQIVANAGWDGNYVLIVGGVNCTDTMPSALRQRTYLATVMQDGRHLEVRVADGLFLGSGLGGQLQFDLQDYAYYGYYGYHGPSIEEVLADGNRLVVAGWVTPASSSSGFAGTFFGGSMTLYPPGGPRSVFPLDKSNAIGTCESRDFSLMRR